MDQCFAGIDVSKSTLNVAVRRDGHCIAEFCTPNTTAGHRQIARRLSRYGSVLIAVEPTANHSLDLCLDLAECDRLDVALVNPAQARHFMAAALQRAKTDPLDARGLALLAECLQPPVWNPPSAAALQLRALARRLADLAGLRTAEICRCKAALACTSQQPAADSTARIISCLEAEIKLVEQQARELIEADAGLHRKFTILSSIKGVGLRSGIQLLAELACAPPDLERRQCVAFFGLDPLVRESGTSLQGRRRISRRGSTQLRRILFIVALVACRHEPVVIDWYDRLVERGKPKRVAQCAVMRKLLCTFWGMLKNDQPFSAEKFSHAG